MGGGGGVRGGGIRINRNPLVVMLSGLLTNCVLGDLAPAWDMSVSLGVVCVCVCGGIREKGRVVGGDVEARWHGGGGGGWV